MSIIFWVTGLWPATLITVWIDALIVAIVVIIIKHRKKKKAKKAIDQTMEEMNYIQAELNKREKDQ